MTMFEIPLCHFVSSTVRVNDSLVQSLSSICSSLNNRCPGFLICFNTHCRLPSTAKYPFCTCCLNTTDCFVPYTELSLWVGIWSWDYASYVWAELAISDNLLWWMPGLIHLPLVPHIYIDELVQNFLWIVACRLIGIKLFSKPMMTFS